MIQHEHLINALGMTLSMFAALLLFSICIRKTYHTGFGCNHVVLLGIACLCNFIVNLVFFAHADDQIAHWMGVVERVCLAICALQVLSYHSKVEQLARRIKEDGAKGRKWHWQ